MPSAIDHLVIAVPDPDAAARELEAELGIAATGGGEHPGVGTSNRLAFLGDAYFELIGVRDVEAAVRWPVGAATLRALSASQGLATYAVLDDELEATVARLRASGSTIGQVTPGSRMRPDGERVEWWTATFRELGPDLPPFLIRHAYAGAEWSDEALERRRAFVHPAGTPISLSGLDLASRDPAAVVEAYARELGIRFLPEPDALGLRIGPHRVRVLAAGARPVVHLTGGLTAAWADLFGMRFVLTGQP